MFSLDKIQFLRIFPHHEIWYFQRQDFEAVSNTKWFLLESNENFFPEGAEDAEIGEIVDPSNPPQKGKYSCSNSA